MRLLRFPDSHQYRSTSEGIVIAIEIAQRDRSLELSAVLDTGSEYCLFDRRVAESLGIDVESGVPLKLCTMAGSFAAFGHEVTLRTYHLEWGAMVYFHDQMRQPHANFLGRTGWQIGRAHV